MSKQVGQLNDIFIFFEKHLGKKMPEGVRVHLASVYAAMITPALHILTKPTLGDSPETAHRNITLLAGLLNIGFDFVLKPLVKEEPAVLVAFTAKSYLSGEDVLPPELEELTDSGTGSSQNFNKECESAVENIF